MQRDLRTGPVVSLAAVALVGALVGVPAGCTDQTSRSLGLADEWTQPIEALGMMAVNPPDEDLRVGDVFVYTFDPEGDQPDPDTEEARRRAVVPRWTSLPVLQEVRDEYLGRPAFPATASPPGTGQADWPEPANPVGQSIFADDVVTTRLRLTSLAGLSGTVIDRGNMSGFIPSETIALTMGPQWSYARAITVKVTAAEAYALPLKRLLPLLLDEVSDGNGTRKVLKPEHLPLLDVYADPNSDHVWMRVAAEVMYMRVLDMLVSAIPPPEVPKDVPPPDLQAAPPPPPEEPVEVEDPAVAAFRRAKEINALLAESGADRVPGGSVRLLSVTDDAVVLRRTWQRGLAVGVRGVCLEVDKTTGEILRMGPLGFPLPDLPEEEPETDATPSDPSSD